MPDSYLRIAEALGDHHLAGRRVELPELDLALVGGRPLSAGGPHLRYPVPGLDDWSLERWAEEVAELCLRALTSERIQKENLGVTRSNLALAKVRESIGVQNHEARKR